MSCRASHALRKGQLQSGWHQPTRRHTGGKFGLRAIVAGLYASDMRLSIKISVETPAFVTPGVEKPPGYVLDHVPRNSSLYRLIYGALVWGFP